MTNVTFSIAAAVYRDAKIRAMREGTSVNALLREYLLEYAGRPKIHHRAKHDQNFSETHSDDHENDHYDSSYLQDDIYRDF